MKRRSISLSEERFEGTLAGMESFFQIDKRPIGVICLARSRILPASSRLIYALKLFALRYIRIQSHPLSRENISISVSMRPFPLTCPRRDYKIAVISLDRMPLKAQPYGSVEGGFLSDRPLNGPGAEDPLISKRVVHEQEGLSQPSSAKLTGWDDDLILRDRRTGPIAEEDEMKASSESPYMRKDSLPQVRALKSQMILPGSNFVKAFAAEDLLISMRVVHEQEGLSPPSSVKLAGVDDGLVLRDRRTGPIAEEDEMKASSESPYMRKNSLPQARALKSQMILPGGNLVNASKSSYEKTIADLPQYKGRWMLSMHHRSSQSLAGGVAHPASAKLAATQERIMLRTGMLHIGQGVSLGEEIMRKVNTLNVSLDLSAQSRSLLKGQSSMTIGADSKIDSERDAAELKDSYERSVIPSLVQLKPPEISKHGNYDQKDSLGGLDAPFIAAASMKTAKKATFAGQAASVRQDDWQDLRKAERRMDINSLAERVYTIIEKKTKIEMERRGLYPRS